jgi:hypothetical protein
VYILGTANLRSQVSLLSEELQRETVHPVFGDWHNGVVFLALPRILLTLLGPQGPKEPEEPGVGALPSSKKAAISSESVGYCPSKGASEQRHTKSARDSPSRPRKNQSPRLHSKSSRAAWHTRSQYSQYSEGLKAQQVQSRGLYCMVMTCMLEARMRSRSRLIVECLYPPRQHNSCKHINKRVM